MEKLMRTHLGDQYPIPEGLGLAPGYALGPNLLLMGLLGCTGDASDEKDHVTPTQDLG